MGNDFITNPGGSKSGGSGGQPPTYGESLPQQQGDDPDINPAEIPAGGKLPFTKPGPDEGNPIGTGKKPFRVS